MESDLWNGILSWIRFKFKTLPIIRSQREWIPTNLTAFYLAENFFAWALLISFISIQIKIPLELIPSPLSYFKCNKWSPAKSTKGYIHCKNNILLKILGKHKIICRLVLLIHLEPLIVIGFFAIVSLILQRCKLKAILELRYDTSSHNYLIGVGCLWTVMRTQ